ncbi:hypothetical protein BpHYR1_004785 [Brachionus plicatilis]|uniref:Uncharacterized protein n=1 Tax=Brachionus plicatilis TaxID=10195 RepID=A0A3M7RDW1_BRAPC|nr:hypothetical protein BpHYR1_004785 [Brachionus plicatilis]
MFPSNSDSRDQMKTVINVRQADDDALYENGNFKYTTLVNQSDSELGNCRDTDEFVNQKIGSNFLNASKMVKSSSDQKIPDMEKTQQYVYVNKNGFAVKSDVSPAKPAPTDKKQKADPKSLICTDLLLEVYKTNKENLTKEENMLNFNQDRQSGRSVPTNDRDPSLASLNLSSNSLVQRDQTGNVIINTSLAIQEPSSEFNSDHVKYINLVSVICCWCFPLTGLLGIFFARKTKRYFENRDLNRAKKYLNRAEWMLILTFFFGCTLIAILFALMEFYWFKAGSDKVSVNRHLSGTLFHKRSLQK